WRYTYVNPKAAELIGRPAQELVGQFVWTEFPESTDRSLREAMARAAIEQTPQHIDVHDVRRDRWYENRIYPSPEGISVFVQYITERLRLLEAEQAARKEAESANRAKSEFLTIMSHELRTPLNAIAGHVQLLSLGIHGPIDDAQREALDRIDRSQRHLLRLVN